VGGQSRQRLAQTLTVERGGELAGVFLPIRCSAGPLYVELRNVVAGKPGSKILAREVLDGALLDVPIGRFLFIEMPTSALTGGLTLYVNMQVAIVVGSQGASCGYSTSSTTPNYPGGAGFYDGVPGPGAWIALAGSPGAGGDLAFQLVLRTP
jgi:hypothetical protein